jgi:sec-independent protein translocase protein TatC
MGPETNARMPLTAHLEELRWRILRALVALAVAFAVCYWLSERLFDVLIAPLQDIEPGKHLVIGTGVTEAFFTKLKVSFIAALFLASPVVFFQAWRFVAPGLYENEKRFAFPFSIAASFFFWWARGSATRSSARSASASSSPSMPRSGSHPSSASAST